MAIRLLLTPPVALGVPSMAVGRQNPVRIGRMEFAPPRGHGRTCSTSPPTIGPEAPPIEAAVVSLPIARPPRAAVSRALASQRERVRPCMRSQGPLTVYYRFVKKHASQKKAIREFLVDFEAERRDNRKRASTQPPAGDVDVELLTYDYLSRSPNDQTSCQRRYAILESRLIRFLKSSPT